MPDCSSWLLFGESRYYKPTARSRFSTLSLRPHISKSFVNHAHGRQVATCTHDWPLSRLFAGFLMSPPFSFQNLARLGGWRRISNEKIVMQSLFEKEKSQTKVHSEVYIVTGKGAKWSARPRSAWGALHELHGVPALLPCALLLQKNS